MTPPDFEALGRYTHACELFERALSERYDALVTLRRAVEQVTRIDHGRPAPTAFDAARCRELLDRASDAHARLLVALSDANSCAVAAGKPPLSLR